MHIQPLSGSLGAQVSDIDLGAVDDGLFEQIAQALWQHQVLVFKQQDVTIEQHVALGKRFGTLHTHPAAAGVDGHPEILLLRNKGKDKNITQVWHSDVSCEEQPPSISILRAIELPPSGGDTMWANQYAALDRLSDGLRSMIEPLRAVHRGFELQATHPVVRTHPETGRKALYVNLGFTSHFEHMTPAESKPLLHQLASIGSDFDLTMRHSWSVGDIVMWDNRCVMHYAIHDYGDEPREMHRVTVRGERPV